MDFYKIVEDENEMKWFFDHVIVDPEPYETYMVCLSARSKKLDEEERKIYQLGRGEMMRTEIIRRKGRDWNFNIWKQALYKYNCDKNAMLTKSGLPYPEKSLVCYCYVNPSDELNCVDDTITFYNSINKELLQSFRKGSKVGVIDHLEKLPKVFEHLRSCHATNLSRRIWRDFDFDLSETGKSILLRNDIEKIIHEVFTKKFGKGNFIMIKTTGGYHVLLKVEALKSNPNDFIGYCTRVCQYEVEKDGYEKGNIFDEVKMTESGSQFVPVPGTLQYGNPIKVVNKKDFE